MSKNRKGKGKAREVEPDSGDDLEDSDSNTAGYANPKKSKNARNPSGKNQYASTPKLDEIAGLLRQYHKDNHNFHYPDYINALARDHGYKIGCSKLATYLTQLGLSTSSRGNRMPKSQKTQIILDELAKDPLQTRGPRVVKESLNFAGHKIGRDEISDVMHDYAGEGFEKRHPRSKKKIVRTHLTAVGPDDEWSLDGHDKLNAAGFGTYGIRDKWGGKYLHYRITPRNAHRHASVVGVIYLECVKKRGGIPVQASSDRGSEIRDAFAFQKSLREMYAPDLVEDVIPSWVCLPSPNNITVESGWRVLFYTWGVNVLEFYDSGLNDGFFERGNYLHEQTANWLWFPAVQRSLDKFCYEQNNHRVRTQKDKTLPSGGTREQLYSDPIKYGGQNCLIPVDADTVDMLLSECEDGYNKLRYVDEEFDPIAEAAYVELGEPEVTVENAWTVFRSMIGKLQDV